MSLSRLETLDPPKLQFVGGNISEDDRRRALLSSDSVEEACSHKCTSTRGSYCCPNESRCLDKFSRTEGHKIIRSLREDIWCKGSEEGRLSLNSRQENFVVLLRTMARTRESNTIAFCIGGVIVCKDFFRVWLRFRKHVHYLHIML